MTKTLTGLWHGLYSYPRFLKPVFFTATVISPGISFWGLTREAMEERNGAALLREASISGSRAGQEVHFRKTYDPATGLSHSVDYAGQLSPDDTEVEGEWSIPGAWSGRFLMIRSPGMTEAQLRTVYERA